MSYMNIDIKASNDEFFSLGTINHAITEPIEPPNVEEVVLPLPEAPSNAAPLDNSKEGHPFDPFGGTSWAGKKQGFN